MQRKFITNLGLLLLLNLLIKPFWVFGIDRTVQNVVGSEEFGFYFTVFNFSFLFNILLDLGITNFNNRNIAQNKQLLSKHFSGIVSLKLILGFVYFIITLGLAFLWGYRGEKLSLLALVGFNQFLLQFLLYLRSNISGMLMFRAESLMSVLDRTLMIIIMSVLLWGGFTSSPFKIEWFVYGQTAAYVIAVIIAYFVVVAKSKSLKINWNIPFFLMILRKSAPFALLTLLMTFYNRIDTVMLDKLLPGSEGEIQSGIYAHAYRILEATNQMSFLFAVLLLPLFSHLIKSGQDADLAKIARVAFSLLFVGTLTLAVASYFYSTEIMNLLYDEHIKESASVYSIIIFGVIAVGASYVFATLLTANNDLKSLNYIAAGSVTISLFMNIILVPELMAKGSAIANLSALGFSTIIQLLIVRKKFSLKFGSVFFIRLGLFILLNGIIFYSSTYFDFVDWWVRMLIAIGLSILTAIILRLLNLREFVQIIKVRDS